MVCPKSPDTNSSNEDEIQIRRKINSSVGKNAKYEHDSQIAITNLVMMMMMTVVMMMMVVMMLLTTTMVTMTTIDDDDDDVDNDEEGENDEHDDGDDYYDDDCDDEDDDDDDAVEEEEEERRGEPRGPCRGQNRNHTTGHRKRGAGRVIPSGGGDSGA